MFKNLTKPILDFDFFSKFVLIMKQNKKYVSLFETEINKRIFDLDLLPGINS
jgi:hypothetical protein